MSPDPRRTGGELLPAVAFVASILGAVGFVATLVTSADTQLLGVMVAVMAGGIGVGLVSWAQRFMTPARPDVEPRGRIASTDDEIEQFAADFDVGEYELARRSLLTRLLVGAAGATGLAALVPFASLGPAPDERFTRTPWRRGTRVVDAQGQPVRPEDVRRDAVVTVFPEGDVGDELAQVILVGLAPGRTVGVAGREGWTPGEVAGFSKVCTHAGCPVGLYEAASGQLLCPCHQSTFDVYRGAEPIFGPAASPLPQLPLAVDAEGFLVSTGDFSAPPGPSFWNQRKDWESPS